MKTQNQPNVTMRLWKGRLCVWPGNVQRWIEEDESNELSVRKAPVIGHVPATRLQYGTAERMLREMPGNIANWLREGMPVVVQKAQLPTWSNNCMI
jgi:hypothetical protein